LIHKNNLEHTEEVCKQRIANSWRV